MDASVALLFVSGDPAGSIHAEKHAHDVKTLSRPSA